MFAVIDMTELGILLGAVFTSVVAIMGAFFKYMGVREVAAREERRADRELYREERKEDLAVYSKSIGMLNKTLEKNTESNRDVARSTDRAAKEAADRNGHLAELQLESQKLTRDYNERILNALKKTQKVEEQYVEKQVIKKD